MSLFVLQAAVGFQEAPHPGQVAAAAVADGHQLACLVVGIAAADADGLAGLGLRDLLLQQSAGRVVARALVQAHHHTN